MKQVCVLPEQDRTNRARGYTAVGSTCLRIYHCAIRGLPLKEGSSSRKETILLSVAHGEKKVEPKSDDTVGLSVISPVPEASLRGSRN